MEADLPSELTGPLPRRVCATPQGLWMAVGTTILLAIALASALWLCRNAMQQIRDWQALHRDGSETVGRVTGTKTGRPPVLYYAFTVDGRSYAGRAYATEQRLQGLAVSGPLAIRYVSGNPGVNHPADWDSAPVDSVWFLAPLPIILFGIMFLMSLWLERRLVAEGVPARGVITKCSYGSRSGYIAKYEFRTEEGRVLTKRVGVPGPLEVGSKIWIVYLRQHPWRNQPYPSHNYRVQ